jgi:hypothetical protein
VRCGAEGREKRLLVPFGGGEATGGRCGEQSKTRALARVRWLPVLGVSVAFPCRRGLLSVTLALAQAHRFTRAEETPVRRGHGARSGFRRRRCVPLCVTLGGASESVGESGSGAGGGRGR